AASRRVRAPARQLGTPAPAGVFASVTPFTDQYDEGPASGRSSGPSAVLGLIDAVGPRRNGQPEARRSGHATKSPRFRLGARLDPERRPERSRPTVIYLSSIRELISRAKRADLPARKLSVPGGGDRDLCSQIAGIGPIRVERS